jgi:hypothetical protein
MSDDAHVLQDPPPLVSSLIAHDETVEHTLMNCEDRYILGEDTSIWDPGLVDIHDEDTSIQNLGSVDIHGLIDTVVHLGYRMVPKDIGVCSGIQGHIVISSSLQWHAKVYSGAHGDALECRAEAYLMEHGVSSGEHSARCRSAWILEIVSSVVVVLVMMERVGLTIIVRRHLWMRMMTWE